MSGSRLSTLQRRLLRLLARIEPPGTLTGGAALIGFHLGHRTTRDLDFVWPARAALDRLLPDAEALLRADGLVVIRIQTTPAFARLRVSDGGEACLVDIEALLASGESLGEGLNRAPERDAGFSVLTLAWLLKELDVPMLAREAGMGESEAARLDTFRVRLIAFWRKLPRTKSSVQTRAVRCGYEVPMKERLVRIGDSRGVRLPKPVIEEAGLEEYVDRVGPRSLAKGPGRGVESPREALRPSCPRRAAPGRGGFRSAAGVRDRPG